MTTAIETSNLRRTFNAGKGLRKRGPVVTALADVDLSIPFGEVHGLLGPNGAGKTTLCKILSTVLIPTSGTARVAGHDVVRDTPAVRRAIGVVFGGDRGLYPRLTARENLRFWAALYGVPPRETPERVERLLDRMGLAGKSDQRIETFSRGMKQRLHLARGLVGDPRVLLLDEPTAGMDPVAAREFRSLITEMRTEGRTILLATHDMREAELLCDRVTLIDGGRLLATERPHTLGQWLSKYERVEVTGAPAALLDELSAMPGVASVEVDPATGVARLETDADGAAAAVLSRIAGAGISSVRTSTPTLEDVYLHLIGNRGMAVR